MALETDLNFTAEKSRLEGLLSVMLTSPPETPRSLASPILVLATLLRPSSAMMDMTYFSLSAVDTFEDIWK